MRLQNAFPFTIFTRFRHQRLLVVSRTQEYCQRKWKTVKNESKFEQQLVPFSLDCKLFESCVYQKKNSTFNTSPYSQRILKHWIDFKYFLWNFHTIIMCYVCLKNSKKLQSFVNFPSNKHVKLETHGVGRLEVFQTKHE